MFTQWSGSSHSQGTTALRLKHSAAFVLALSIIAGPRTAVHAQEVENDEEEAFSPSVSVGGGLQTSFIHFSPDEGDSTDRFRLNSLRLYVNGSATENISFMVNTDIEYGGSFGAPNADQGDNVQILDAVGQFGASEKLNLWVGRFLPPSDRANLYGPYFSNHWGVFSDGVQDGYPFIFQGRNNGAMYWGQFDKVKVSFGGFDGAQATGNDTLIGAGRVQVDFWDPEPGYYLNGTFYGDKEILAVGFAGQWQGSDGVALSADVLIESKFGGDGVVSVEAQWARYDKLGGYNPDYETNDGGYVLGAYLFPQTVGMGQFQLLGKYAQARFRKGLTLPNLDFDQKTTEVNVNYIIRQFNARVMFFFKNTTFDAVRTDDIQVGVGLQLQI